FYQHELCSDERGNQVLTIFETPEGTIWVGTLDGLFKRENDGWKRFSDKYGSRENVVQSLGGTDKHLWIGTAAGMYLLQDGKITEQPEIGTKSVRAIYRDREGTYWFGMLGGLGCLRQDGDYKVYTRKDGLPGNLVSALYEDKRSELWVGTYGGLSRYHDGKFSTELDSYGAYYDQVNVIREDDEGDIWVGTRDGLHELRLKRFRTYTRQDGLAQNNICSVLEDQSGNIWLGSWGGGLSKLNEHGIVNYNPQGIGTNHLASDYILSLWEDQDGSMLVGADYEGGAFRMKDMGFKRLWSTEQSMIDRIVRVIYQDHEGNLWFGASSGLLPWNKNQHFLKEHTIRCILEDHAHTLWVGTSGGLFYRKDGEFVDWTGQDGHFNHTVLALHEDREGSLWIGTASNGLARLKDGKITSYTTKDELVSDGIYEILEDDHGWLWMSCSTGIFRVTKKNFDDFDRKEVRVIRCIGYGKADGLETVQCSGVAKPGAWKSRDGRLWFATAKGISVTDPNIGLESNRQPPPVLVEEIVADRKEFSLSKTAEALSRDAFPLVKIPAGRGDLEIHYTGLSFQAPEKMCFKYKLEGVDPDWTEVTRRVAYYNNLAPRTYRFRVKACNNDGVWSERDASVYLVLAPHFWQTWPFIAAVAILGVAMAGGTVRYTTRRNMEKELRRLEKQHAIEQERTRIARDMHDEVGARLTQISFLGAMVKRRLLLPPDAGVEIEKMSQTARDVIRAMDEIVWAVNPAYDTLEHLATYLCRNATELFENSPIVCQLKIPDDLPSCRLGTGVRHNILLAAKEAMNNVVKHSGATNVLVEISVKGEKLELAVSDNGRGVRRETVSETPSATRSERVGNGLKNMHDRLAAIGGQCVVTGQPEQGTRVVLTVLIEGGKAG
ncbi:MAG TPA: two-component regulator propeller domain-containing protein, partial [Verrucomicrobiae bacterium]|nr:two-component regulator propeller domain-containing protein [Verrucomicrobiae bacterium]